MYAEPAQCQQLGTTVFRGRFFQIPWVSLPNFAAHHGRFSTYTVVIRFLRPLNPTKYAVFFGHQPLRDIVCLPNKLAVFQISSIFSIFLPLEPD